MRRLFGLTEKKQEFLSSRARLSLLFCAILLAVAFVFCFFLQSAKEKREHSALIGTRIAEEATEPPTASSPVPMVEITEPRDDAEAEEEATAETPEEPAAGNEG